MQKIIKYFYKTYKKTQKKKKITKLRKMKKNLIDNNTTAKVLKAGAENDT